MLNTTHLESACEETFEDVEAMIRLVVKRHVAKHGGDLDEAIGDANIAFMLAYCSYQPCKAAFTTWVWVKVWGRLMDVKRKISRRANRGHLPLLLEDWGNMPDPKQDDPYPFDSESITERLGPEGRALVRLVLNAPGELREVMANAVNDAVPARRALRRYLRRYMGWTMTDVREGFADVCETLGWDADAGLDVTVGPVFDNLGKHLDFVSYGPNGREG